MNAKVSFIIAGAQKAGTTALDLYLKMHSSICMAGCKEVHFFDRDEFFDAGQADLAYYHSFFKEPEKKLLGEATPSYMFWADAPRRIWQYNPDMKLIVVLRNPVDRAYSHWNMERERGSESLSFFEAISQELRRCREILPKQHLVYSYTARGFYLNQLRRLWGLFSKEQVLVLKYEGLRENPVRLLTQVCEFLEVAPLMNVPAIEANVIAYESPILQSDRLYLQGLFEHEIRSLELELGWDCSDWLS